MRAQWNFEHECTTGLIIAGMFPGAVENAVAKWLVVGLSCMTGCMHGWHQMASSPSMFIHVITHVRTGCSRHAAMHAHKPAVKLGIPEWVAVIWSSKGMCSQGSTRTAAIHIGARSGYCTSEDRACTRIQTNPCNNTLKAARKAITPASCGGHNLCAL
jgi:hypothetical protein